TFADQFGVALHDHPLHIAIRPDAAMISGAFRRIACAQVLIRHGAILIFLLRRLVLLQLVLILLLLCLILGIVGGSLRRGICIRGFGGDADLIVDPGGFSLFCRRGMGRGHAIGIHAFALGNSR